MAHLSLYITLFSLLAISVCSQPPPPLDNAEQESVYQFMESVNSDVAWRALFPDDLCTSGPHGVVCDYFSDGTPHVTELSFGYISDYSPNPPCNPHSTLNPSLLAPLPHLTKLMFYKCFKHSKTMFPYFNASSSLEELVFIDNPGLTGSMEGRICNLRRLRRLIVTGTSVSGGIFSDGFGEFPNLEQLTLSRNRFDGEISTTVFESMKKLKVLDLSENGFEGNVPESLGYTTELLKIDLSHNKFSGRMPESLKGLKSVELVDLSYNRFEGVVPEEIGELEFVKELNLEGNNLSGRVPFSAGFVSKLGGMLRLEGNLDLCIDESVKMTVNGKNDVKICRQRQPYVAKTALFYESSGHAPSLGFLVLGFFLAGIVVCLFDVKHHSIEERGVQICPKFLSS